MKRLASLLAACLALSCNSPAPPAASQPDATTSMSATGGTGTGLAQDATAQAILAKLGLTTPQGGSGTGLCQDATLQILLANIGGGGIAGTCPTVTSGSTSTLLRTDACVRFDTTGGTPATVDMIAPGFIGRRITFYWWAWAGDAGGPTPPTVVADSGHSMVPFSGQATSGAAGLVSTSTINTPGASYTLLWDGTEWTKP